MKNEINELRHMCDTLLCQVITMYARERAMLHLVVAVAGDTLPEEKLQKHIDAYADELKHETLDALHSIQDTLFYPRQGRLISEELDLIDYVSRLKKGDI